MKEYPLSLSVDYLAHWTVEDAVREILQNALDRGNLNYDWERNTQGAGLKINTPDVQLHQSLLLLGNGTKGEGDRGGFGEGFKLALLILAREGLSVQVINGNKIWTPELREDPLFETQMLYIVETDNPNEDTGLTYVIKGLSAIERLNIINRTLDMQDSLNLGKVTQTDKGRILHDKAGMIYVGGLFVCQYGQMDCGYDFEPNVLELNRDRQAVPDWDMKRQAQDMWLLSDSDKVVDMVLNKASEMSTFQYNYSVPSEVCDKFLDKHIEMHGNVPIANTKKDLDEMVVKGYTDAVFIGNEGFSQAVRQSKKYVEVRKEAVLTPFEILDAFYDDYVLGMDSKPRTELAKIIVQAKKWEVKV